MLIVLTVDYDNSPFLAVQFSNTKALVLRFENLAIFEYINIVNHRGNRRIIYLSTLYILVVRTPELH
jgi:hypothetical protein